VRISPEKNPYHLLIARLPEKTGQFLIAQVVARFSFKKMIGHWTGFAFDKCNESS
jgi:hypothetical protein